MDWLTVAADTGLDSWEAVLRPLARNRPCSTDCCIRIEKANGKVIDTDARTENQKNYGATECNKNMLQFFIECMVQSTMYKPVARVPMIF